MEISGAERGRGRRIVVGTCLITSANTDTSAIIYTVRGGGSGGADDWLCFMLMKLDQLQVNFSRRTLRILGPIIHLNYTRFHLFYYIGRRDSDKRLLYARLWRGRVSVPCRSSRECVRACVPACLAFTSKDAPFNRTSSTRHSFWRGPWELFSDLLEEARLIQEKEDKFMCFVLIQN